jgi:hypothetical protein
MLVEVILGNTATSDEPLGRNGRKQPSAAVPGHVSREPDISAAKFLNRVRLYLQINTLALPETELCPLRPRHVLP